jgi:hypothetical protein
VLARGLCRARAVSLAGIPARDRWGRLRVEAVQWRPFDDCEHAADLHGDTAWLYAWDRAAFEARLAGDTGLRVSRVLPETLLFPRPAGDAVRLLRCVDGFAGEVWRGGVMTATRWWPEKPDDEAWALFRRGAGDAAVLEPVPPEVVRDPATSRAPWSTVRLLGRETGETGSSAWLASLLVICLAGPAAWLARDLWAVQRDLLALEAERDELQGRSTSPVQARQEALAALADVDAVEAWLDAPDPTALLAELARRLPADGSTVRSFEVNEGRIRLALSPAAGTPRVAYVRALEEGGVFGNVREEGGEGREAGLLVLTAQAAASSAGVPAGAASAAPAASGALR